MKAIRNIVDKIKPTFSKGGKLDLNGEYAKELGITDPKDKKQLIAARDKAIERANYWENAVVLDEADKTSMDESINAKSGAEAAKREEIQKKAAEKLAAVKEKRTGKKSKEAVSKTETTTQNPSPWGYGVTVGLDYGMVWKKYITPNVGAEIEYKKLTLGVECGVNMSLENSTIEAPMPYLQASIKYRLAGS